MPSVTAELQIQECPTTGSVGVLFSEWGNYSHDYLFACVTSSSFAHDLIEHVNGPSEMGTLRDELEALGACMLIRGLDIERDLGSLLDYFHEQDESEVEEVELDDDYHCQWIEDTITRFVEDNEGEGNLERAAVWFRKCLRIGLKKAQDKYKCRGIAQQMFHYAGLAFDEISNFGLESLEGAFFTVSVNECGYTIDGLDELLEE